MVARTIVAFAVVLCLACGGSATVMQHYLTYSAKVREARPVTGIWWWANANCPGPSRG